MPATKTLTPRHALPGRSKLRDSPFQMWRWLRQCGAGSSKNTGLAGAAQVSTHVRKACELTALALMLCLVGTAAAGPAESQRGMVATVHPLATRAAVEVLEQGGNAIDAAITAGLTLGVVDTANSGIGGGCLILIHSADGKLYALDGREMAPAKATRDMFVIDGEVQTKKSVTGPLASGVPGALAAYAAAVQRLGRMPFAKLLQPGIRLATNGFSIDKPYARRLAKEADALRQFEATRAVLFNDQGKPIRAGERLTQPDLAKTYQAIARHGIDWFYRGPFAEQVEQWMSDHGGLMTRGDLANYRPIWRAPIISTYRNYQVVGFPPPSSGGIHVAQILNILEQFNLQQIYQTDRAAFTHLVAAAMKRAFADRSKWLGDSDFAPVPRGLLDKHYAAQLAKTIDRQKATDVPQHGMPPGWDHDLFGKHTTHVAVADSEGNWVAMTQTINTSFGSGVIVPGTGVMMNSEMDDFSIQPNVPNSFDLIGGDANSIEPGKRPLSSMSPTIVLENGRPIISVGAAGGPTIITQVVLALVRYLDLEQSLDKAVANPRFHHQWRPDKVTVEKSFPSDIIERISAMGHETATRDSMGVTQAIARPTAEGPFLGVHDPRVPGLAAGPKQTKDNPINESSQ